MKTETAALKTQPLNALDTVSKSVVNSNNGLAFLASIALKNALNVNCYEDKYISVKSPSGHIQSKSYHSSQSITYTTCSSLEANTIVATNSTVTATSEISSSATSTVVDKFNQNNNFNKNKNKSKKKSITNNVIATAPAGTVATTTAQVTSTTASVPITAPTSSIAISSTHLSSSSTAPSPLLTTNATLTPTIANGGKCNFQIPSDILDDLASRFIINAPDMELSNMIRVCFQIELAHWFYLDFFCTAESEDEERKAMPCGMKQFSTQIFQHIPFLRQHLTSIDGILEDWKNYKLSVPTYGAILISEDLNYCLLVQSYFAKSSWGFPKGKVNENEEPEHCAAREVFEETGYDITESIEPEDYIEAVINFQYTRLYIVQNVSLQTQFTPRTRNEIKCCDWFPIDSLPISKNDAISKTKLGMNANSFFMIMPFVKRLKKWVHELRNGSDEKRKFSSNNGHGTSSSPQSISPIMSAPIPITPTHANGPLNGKLIGAKKNKQMNNIKNILSLSSSTGTSSGVNGVSGAFNINVNITNNSRAKRQRHKSMGDLDVIKLAALNYSNNLKLANAATPTACVTNLNDPQVAIKTNSASNIINNQCSIVNSNSKRNQAKTAVGCTNNVNVCIKRQLFHSQSQNGSTISGEKIVNSFDLIRKDKQMKAQKMNNNNSNSSNGRVRAKSQCEKNSTIQLQQNKYPKQRLQKQNVCSINPNQNVQPSHNENTTQMDVQQNSNASHSKSPSPTSPITDSMKLLASTRPYKEAIEEKASSNDDPKIVNQKREHDSQSDILLNNQMHLHSEPSKSLQLNESPTKISLILNSPDEPKLNDQLQRQRASVQQHHIKFMPSCDTWKNFSFTKNFIANVFC